MFLYPTVPTLAKQKLSSYTSVLISHGSCKDLTHTTRQTTKTTTELAFLILLGLIVPGILRSAGYALYVVMRYPGFISPLLFPLQRICL